MLALAFALSGSAATWAQDAPKKEAVRLIVMIAVDQMVPDQLERLSPWLEGGFGRFAHDGLVFEHAALQYGDTETGPGHTTYGTGLQPTHHGIVSNEWFGPEAKKFSYCYGDPEGHTVTSAGAESSEGTVSPRNLRAPGMADFVEGANAGAVTIAISSKDRAAIGMSGRHADLALWWDHDGSGFESSSWYAKELPAWVKESNATWVARVAHEFGQGWKAQLPEHFEASGTSPDECDGEWGKPGQRSFPHNAPKMGDGVVAKELAGWVYNGPAGDLLVLDLARSAVDALALGRDDSVDLLALSLSSCDTVGHLYGPHSVEVTDVLLRADRELEKLFHLLDEKVGKEHWIASLSADHGVLELPETLAARGLASKRISGRVIGDSIKAARKKVSETFGQDFYLASHARGIRLSWTAMKDAAVDASAVRKAYAAALRESGADWIEHALTYDELQAIARKGAEASELARLEANSFDEERTCDVVILWKTLYLVGVPFGTTHGTPYPYDRAIPLAFYGPGFAHARNQAACGSVDAVPTLLARVGLPLPQKLDGRDLLATK